MSRPRRNKNITDQLRRIEQALIYHRDLSSDYCISYINWARRFGKISYDELSYFSLLVEYHFYKMTADEEEALMELVATRPI